MTLEELRKKAEEYAEDCRTEREQKLYEELQQWGIESLSQTGMLFLWIQLKLARNEGYVAGATENGIVWHDLQKNPNDLPDDEREVMEQSGVWVMYTNGHWRYVYGGKWEDDAPVCAWTEIPEFKEEI